MPRLTLVVAAATVVATLLAAVFFPRSVATGEGNGTHGECSDAEVQGVGPNYTNDSDDRVVTGVCVKSGSGTDGSGHSPVLGNGEDHSECYFVIGVGTSSVSVALEDDDDDHGSKDIGHIDVLLSPLPDTPTPTDTSAPPKRRH